MNESLTLYLSSKRLIKFRAKSYYKVKSYKESYFIEETIFNKLGNGPTEVILEKNQHSSSREKGMIKWDNMQKKILISKSKVRILYEVFQVE